MSGLKTVLPILWLYMLMTYGVAENMTGFSDFTETPQTTDSPLDPSGATKISMTTDISNETDVINATSATPDVVVTTEPPLGPCDLRNYVNVELYTHPAFQPARNKSSRRTAEDDVIIIGLTTTATITRTTGLSFYHLASGITEALKDGCGLDWTFPYKFR